MNSIDRKLGDPASYQLPFISSPNKPATGSQTYWVKMNGIDRELGDPTFYQIPLTNLPG